MFALFTSIPKLCSRFCVAFASCELRFRSATVFTELLILAACFILFRHLQHSIACHGISLTTSRIYSTNNGTNRRASLQRNVRSRPRRLDFTTPSTSCHLTILHRLRLVSLRHNRHRRRRRPNSHHGPAHRHYPASLRTKALSRNASQRR